MQVLHICVWGWILIIMRLFWSRCIMLRGSNQLTLIHINQFLYYFITHISIVPRANEAGFAISCLAHDGIFYDFPCDINQANKLGVCLYGLLSIIISSELPTDVFLEVQNACGLLNYTVIKSSTCNNTFFLHVNGNS